MENIFPGKNSKASCGSMHRCWDECGGINHAAALHEQICVTKHRCHNSVCPIWNNAVPGIYSYDGDMGKSDAGIFHGDNWDLDFCVVCAKNTI